MSPVQNPSTSSHKSSMFSYPRQDVVAGIVVFLVAVPLCLGIAIASGVPPVSGLIAGVVGGLVVPLFSRSPLSVTGPAAGLVSIVLMEIERLGGVSAFVTAVMLAGLLQIGFGLLRAGALSGLVPGAVIKGMLAAIGITIVTKQLPVAVGIDGGLKDMLNGGFSAGAIAITAISLVVLYGWKHTPLKKIAFLSPAMVVVVLASVLGVVFAGVPALALHTSQFVNVPLGGITALAAAVPRPDFAAMVRPEVWVAALTIAVVASIETLLSLQAVDRLDPLRRRSPPNQELFAQGVGNAVSGFLGGLPVTAVIVRSGANVAAGGRERLSAVVHGLLLGGSVVFAGSLLNMIPLAALAAVLIQVGLNLCKVELIRSQIRLGINQLIPFAATIIAVLATDLLKGVIAGLIIGIVFALRQNAQGTVATKVGEFDVFEIKLTRDATFLVKPALLTAFEQVKDNQKVRIDGTHEHVDQDVKEAIAGFMEDAKHRGITVELVAIDLGGASAAGGH